MIHAGPIAQAGASPALPPVFLEYWDAAAGVGSVNANVNCNAWAGRLGAFNCLQNTAGARPAISTTGGFPSLLFNGTSHCLPIVSLSAPASVRTYYAVTSPIDLVGTRVLCDVASGRDLVGADSGKHVAFDGSFFSLFGTAYATGLQRVAYQVQGGTGTALFRKNGTLGTARDWGGTHALGGAAAIGSHSNGAAFFFSGHLLWFGISQAPYDAGVAAYLAWRFGV